MIEKKIPATPSATDTHSWDIDSDPHFYNYYKRESQSEQTIERFRVIQKKVLDVIETGIGTRHNLRVADIGCGAGTQSVMWAKLGHHVHGLDINKPLIDFARERVKQMTIDVEFCVGSATELPWSNESMDVCLAPELLEHVAEWQTCLDECARVIRPGGVLFVTTTNKLCPVQEEFNLPLYSWYPSVLKQHFLHLVATKRPELANYAKYPAVNWFSFYSLRSELASRGFSCCMDRFDMMDVANRTSVSKMMILAVRRYRLLRWLAHVATPYTMVIATKRGIQLNGAC
jgi:2-polyprenyl-6-hydroxyphenyl methylase/3-demethylubiquinone-9 3-methyltransferase